MTGNVSNASCDRNGGLGPVTYIDLRSDTVTRPTEGMRAAMAAADVGDDLYGEDPSVRALESECAALFGKPAAMFTPTVTMGNQICLSMLARPGDEVVCDVDAHVVRYEGGAAAVVGGIQTRTTAHPRGRLDLGILDGMVRERPAGPGAGSVRTAALVVEQTHNQGGGAVYPLDELAALREFATGRGVAIHCDGARVWNAHVASGIPLASWAATVDTLAVCLSKGLGCPAGGVVLLPDAGLLLEARRLRRRLGGSMRQVGVLAAAGLYALRHHVERLADDHAHARALAAAAGPAVAGAVETNIVYLDLPRPAVEPFVDACRAEGVLVSVVQDRRARLVTHLDVDGAAVRRACDVVSRAVAGVG